MNSADICSKKRPEFVTVNSKSEFTVGSQSCIALHTYFEMFQYFSISSRIEWFIVCTWLLWFVCVRSLFKYCYYYRFLSLSLLIHGNPYCFLYHYPYSIHTAFSTYYSIAMIVILALTKDNNWMIAMRFFTEFFNRAERLFVHLECTEGPATVFCASIGSHRHQYDVAPHHILVY